MQAEVHVGYWLAFRTAVFFQFGNTLACTDRGGCPPSNGGGAATRPFSACCRKGPGARQPSPGHSKKGHPPRPGPPALRPHIIEPGCSWGSAAQTTCP